MKTKSELTDFYYKSLFPILKDLEENRKQLKYRIIIIGIIFTLIYSVIGIFVFNAANADLDILLFALVGYIGIGGFIYKLLIKDYTAEFKSKIIKPLISVISENLIYSSKTHLPERLFKRSDIFSDPDRVSGNDYVKGKLDDINLQFSDFHAEKKHKDSKGRTNWSTIFRGLFLVAEFNKNFKGKTIVLPDTAQSTFGDLIGNWLQSYNIKRDELVKMDNPEFEKEFVVYSTDQIEARYILSHAIMDKLLRFQKKSNHPVYISFVGDHIHMAIYYDKDMFEPSIFRSLLEYRVAMEYVDTLHLATGIIQELKLNQKLWSKE